MVDVARTDSEERMPFDKFRDFTKNLFNVSKEYLDEALKREKQEVKAECED